MRFLGITEYNQLGSMYLSLLKAGHAVRVSVDDPLSRDVLRGIVPQVRDYRRGLEWVGKSGIVIFESALKGNLQDRLRREGYAVIGGSTFGDRLENDRKFGQRLFEKMGLKTARTRHFHSYERAIAFVKRHPGRYVLKNNGPVPSILNYIGGYPDGKDLIARLQFHLNQTHSSQEPDFILMDYVQGIEVGVGAYFNGEDFLKPALLDWEHKRFFPGDLGELTGEMGTVVTYRGAEVLFNETLAKIRPVLKKSGYCGYMNVNLILNEEGIWPLEFTSRFGYPGFAVCQALHEEGWDEILPRLVHKGGLTFKTRPGYSVGLVLTVPPFPYGFGYRALSHGMPISFSKTLTAEEERHLHFAEVSQKGGSLVTGGERRLHPRGHGRGLNG